jgi:hypothetical protein
MKWNRGIGHLSFGYAGILLILNLIASFLCNSFDLESNRFLSLHFDGDGRPPDI